MAVNGLADAMAWAQHTFGELDLGDPRRTRRLVQVAGAIAADPQASLPRHMAGEWSALKAVYRLLRADGVSHEAIRGAVCQQTRQQMQQGPEDGVLLLVHDDPELDYGYHSALAGLGPIGNGSHRGFFVHSVLAMGPTQDSERILGLVHQEPWVRVPAPRQRDGGKRSSRERGERPRESEVWTRAVEQVGPAPSRQVWIHVGDRYADMFAFLQRCRQMGTFFVVRAAQNRRVLVQEHEAQPHLDHLLDCARSWPAQATGSIEVPSEHERRARVAQVQLSWASMQLLAPENGPEAGSEPLPLWVLRVWEPQPPDKEVAQREYVPSGKHGSKGKPEVESEQVEALEGILLSALPVDNEQQAWQVIASYRSRWPIEDLHRGLKTGCRIEQRHLQEQRSARESTGRGFSHCRALTATAQSVPRRARAARPGLCRARGGAGCRHAAGRGGRAPEPQAVCEVRGAAGRLSGPQKRWRPRLANALERLAALTLLRCRHAFRHFYRS